MLGLIAIAASVALAVLGHLHSRDFTRRRLRYTAVAERPLISGILAGFAVGLLAAPLTLLLPLLTSGTAMLLGAGVGTGVFSGARNRELPS